MKKITLSVFLLSSILSQAQVEFYRGNTHGIDLFLTVKDNEYILGKSIGKLVNENGENKIKSSNQLASAKVIEGISNEIEINFKCRYHEYLTDKYKIAYLDNKNVKQYIDIEIDLEKYDYESELTKTVKIPKTNKFFLVISFDTTTASELTYELPQNVKSVDLEMQYPFIDSINSELDVSIRNNGLEIEISENGTESVVFYKNADMNNRVDALEIAPKSVLTVPSKFKNVQENNISTYENDDSEENNSKLKEQIKINSAKNISDGLKKIKKSESEFLIVVVENKEANEHLTYNEIVDVYKSTIISDNYFYDDTDSKQIIEGIKRSNKFTFVNASNNDEKWLKQNGFDLKTPRLIFVDKNGIAIKYSNNPEINNYDLSNSFVSINENLKQFNGLEKVNKLYELLNKKKVNSQDVFAILKDINLATLSSKSNFMPQPETNYESVEEYDMNTDYLSYNYDTNYKYTFPEFSKDKVFKLYNDYLDTFAKNIKPEMILVIENELSRNGFSAVLFNMISSRSLTETDFKSMNILIDNAELVVKYKNEKYLALEKENAEMTDFNYIDLSTFDKTYDSAIIDAINSQYYNLSSENLASTNQSKNNIFNIIKKLYKTDPTKLIYLTRYYDVLTQGSYEVDYKNIDFNDFYIIYSDYFSREFKTGKSVIEILDHKFSEHSKQTYNYFLNWIEYKNIQANLANNVSWSVVENRDKSKYIDALNWAKFAVNLDSQNYFYLDTLAHLYYLSGDKDKAIQTQQLAAKMAKLAKDSFSESNTTLILEKMINGTL